jgi:catechol 2,3-dioxygenase-like lactoylglutathione lyase family enzyme
MTVLNYILLAVANPRRSAELYSKLLGTKPVENSETFVLYILPNGMKLGLWVAAEIEPKPKPPGGVEVTFSEDDGAAVMKTHEAWSSAGAKIVQAPTRMDFGFTFTAEDLDGHRLRVFARADEPR